MDINPFIIIFAVASMVAILAKLIRWPYTIALVIAGMIVVALGLEAPFVLDKNLIFHILLPPLLFEGALHMRLSHLKKNVKVIALLIIPGLMLSVLLVAVVLNVFFPAIPLIITLLFAAIIIPTDPASILAFYKDMKVPKMLKSIIEGESVFDDGLAIVLFNVIVGIILIADFSGGRIDVGGEAILSGIGTFLKLSIVGVLFGAAMGYITFLLLKRINDKFTEVMITVILAFGIFAVAEMLGASGVLAVVVSGLILGNYGTKLAMAPSTRMSLINFWSFLAFAVNSFLFILVGMSVSLQGIWDNALLITASVLLLWFARALMIFLIGKLANHKKKELPKTWQVTMWWGGLRGAIPIAMALSIPAFLDNGGDFPYIEEIKAATFGVVLATLLIQGLTLRPLLKKLGFYSSTKKEAEQEEREIAALVKDTMDELGTLVDDGELTRQGYDWLTSRFSQINSQLITEMGMLIREHGFIPKEEYTYTVKETLESKKDIIKDAWARNLISGTIGEKLIYEIEGQLRSLSAEMADSAPRTPVEILRSVTGEKTPIERNCGICLETIEQNEEMIRCRCGTLFHSNCLEGIDRCPICIAVLDTDNPTQYEE